MWGMDMAEMALLHIYGQEAWHDDVYLVGNRAGLSALKTAIEEALAIGKGQTPEKGQVFVSDGEGYSVKVLCNDEDWQGEFWGTLAVPYTEDFARDNRENAVGPWKLWGPCA